MGDNSAIYIGIVVLIISSCDYIYGRLFIWWPVWPCTTVAVMFSWRTHIEYNIHSGWCGYCCRVKSSIGMDCMSYCYIAELRLWEISIVSLKIRSFLWSNSSCTGSTWNHIQICCGLHHSHFVQICSCKPIIPIQQSNIIGDTFSRDLILLEELCNIQQWDSIYSTLYISSEQYRRIHDHFKTCNINTTSVHHSVVLHSCIHSCTHVNGNQHDFPWVCSIIFLYTPKHTINKFSLH